jgi:hypothetical protein
MRQGRQLYAYPVGRPEQLHTQILCALVLLKIHIVLVMVVGAAPVARPGVYAGGVQKLGAIGR